MNLFFDTMAYLHFRPLDQVNLTELGVDEPLTVVIPRITVRELDQIKNTGPSPKLRERARSRLKRVEQWTADGAVREGVQVTYYSGLPSAEDLETLGLNPGWADDVLMGTVLRFMGERPGQEVVLLTEDTGARLRASELGLDVRTMPEAWRLAETTDPLEAENAKLSRELERMRNARPALAVSFGGYDEPTDHKTFHLRPAPADLDDALSRKLDELRLSYPKLDASGRGETKAKPGTPAASIARAMTQVGPSEGEYERYNRDVDSFLKAYADYMREMWSLQTEFARTIRFKVEIMNLGSSPAEDVDVHLHFPDGFLLRGEDDLPYVPKEPRPPVKPRTLSEMLRLQVAVPDLYPPRMTIPNASLSSFSIRETNSYEVSDHFLRIKHGDKAGLPEMFVTFETYDSVASFNCEYIVRPANLPDPVEGKLHFIYGGVEDTPAV